MYLDNKFNVEDPRADITCSDGRAFYFLLENIGEGLCGDYNPDDPEDINFLRFTGFSLEDNMPIDDFSYCTTIPADISPELLEKGIQYIALQFKDAYDNGISIKKLGERLSWLDEETIEKLQQISVEKGWKIPAVHRIDNSVKKAGYHSLPVAVIELCKPSHAANILGSDDDKVVTSMMPCRVSVYETRRGKVIVSRMNTGLISKVFSETVSETMEAASKETEEIFETVIKM